MIYIVDDDEYVRRAYKLLLDSVGYNSLIYSDAINFLRECKPSESDLLILDMHMAEMSGYDLLKIQQKNNFKMPVIIVTAYDNPQARNNAHNYGVVAFLRKPIDADALIDIIKYHHPN